MRRSSRAGRWLILFFLLFLSAGVAAAPDVTFTDITQAIAGIAAAAGALAAGALPAQPSKRLLHIAI
ncbi:MAG: hypothetical protein DMG77_14065 [Acidobacteria bacterium]|nr:MAG: hypothetical protein DMG77_14065 [Acidobacteriota bacterium]